jgi:NAD(P)-dependent dehydrogenase (short-subunit alcohol dehydrogenase family)
MRINYHGTKNVTEALLPLVQSSADGRIVNVTSAFGLLRDQGTCPESLIQITTLGRNKQNLRNHPI